MDLPLLAGEKEQHPHADFTCSAGGSIRDALPAANETCVTFEVTAKPYKCGSGHASRHPPL